MSPIRSRPPPDYWPPPFTPLRRIAGEREGPALQAREGEVPRRSLKRSTAAHLVSGIFGKVSGRTAVRSSRPSPDLSPFPPEAYPAGERGTRSGVFLQPEQLLGRQSPDEQGREWEDATARQDCRHRCFQAEGRGVHSLAATAAVRAEHAAGRSGVDCLVACQRGRAGGDGSQRRLRA